VPCHGDTPSGVELGSSGRLCRSEHVDVAVGSGVAASDVAEKDSEPEYDEEAAFRAVWVVEPIER
jgi:hypothetical protein